MKKMIDLHMHIIPDVDDGSDSLLMSEKMLRMAIAQGVEVVFATSHSFVYEKYPECAEQQYCNLQKMIKDKELPIKVYLGCEMLYDSCSADRVIADLESGRIPSMNGTKYVLAELKYNAGEDMMYYLKRLIKKGWIPILAHAERLRALSVDAICTMREAGCLIQINAYSISEEGNAEIRNKALCMLEKKLVDFVGSDAHRTDHRSPAVAKGIEYLYAYFDENYVDDILYNNAMELLIKELD